jgi:hypothetical protein
MYDTQAFSQASPIHRLKFSAARLILWFELELELAF